MEQLILEVSQVNTYIKEMLDSDELLGNLCIRGELSNYKMYPSGHHYFTLKDGQSALRCVMFRSSAMRLRFRPENGMTVLAAGRITVYPRDGQYQLYCTSMTPEGAGDLAVAFEQLKKKLAAEGLFDEAHKKPLPAYPHRIALVTSPAGAAVRDMLRILGRRYPLSEVTLLPVRVQGTEAPAEIADAIRYANRFHVADVLITGRGGGSVEDLWAFNEELVARAIYDSQIPVVSAVGHEPDVTIADYVADVRASTPSNAAELTAPDQMELRASIRGSQALLFGAIQKKLKLSRQQLTLRKRARVLESPQNYLDDRRQQLDGLLTGLSRGMGSRVLAARGQVLRRQMQLAAAEKGALLGQKHRLSAAAVKLDAMSPLKVLTRGYSIARRPDGTAVRSASQLTAGDRLSLRFSDGSASAVVDSVTED